MKRFLFIAMLAAGCGRTSLESSAVSTSADADDVPPLVDTRQFVAFGTPEIVATSPFAEGRLTSIVADGEHLVVAGRSTTGKVMTWRTQTYTPASDTWTQLDALDFAANDSGEPNPGGLIITRSRYLLVTGPVVVGLNSRTYTRRALDDGLQWATVLDITSGQPAIVNATASGALLQTATATDETMVPRWTTKRSTTDGADWAEVDFVEQDESISNYVLADTAIAFGKSGATLRVSVDDGLTWAIESPVFPVGGGDRMVLMGLRVANDDRFYFSGYTTAAAANTWTTWRRNVDTTWTVVDQYAPAGSSCAAIGQALVHSSGMTLVGGAQGPNDGSSSAGLIRGTSDGSTWTTIALLDASDAFTTVLGMAEASNGDVFFVGDHTLASSSVATAVIWRLPAIYR